ncbi:hypothetical protein FRC15_011541 [Serendipita sp. 397]|nr:hypothetical protein FRC15_011541 [Serendipita sp. 397]
MPIAPIVTRLIPVTRLSRCYLPSIVPIRAFHTNNTHTTVHHHHSPVPVVPTGFTYIPGFLSQKEQLSLTRAALAHLDNVGPTAARRKQKRLIADGSVSIDEHGFLPEDSCYEFEQGHFDGVIRHYREARITDPQWASLDSDGELITILQRIKSLLPSVDTQCHVLHLSSRGEILPHIDNVDASGSIILGVSLGSARVLRLESVGHQTTEDGLPLYYELLLEPGSCYIQRLVANRSGDNNLAIYSLPSSDPVRYTHKHSIPKVPGTIHRGQRLSIMMRDMPTPTS